MRERKGGQAPPRAVPFPLFLSFVFPSQLVGFSRGRWVEGGEYLTMTAQAGPRLGKG